MAPDQSPEITEILPPHNRPQMPLESIAADSAPNVAPNTPIASPVPNLPPAKSTLPNGRTCLKHPDVTRDTAKMLYMQGVTGPEIAAAVGVTAPLVRKWMERYRWGEQRDLMRSRAHSAAVFVVQTSLSSVSKTLRSDLANELQSQADALKAKPVKSVADLGSNRLREGRTRVVKQLVEAASIVCGWEQETKIGLIVPMCGPAEPAAALEVESSAIDSSQDDAPAAISAPAPSDSSPAA